MRPVLIRLLLDEPWAWLRDDPAPLAIGIAWAWVLYGVLTTAWAWRAGAKDVLTDKFGWCAYAGVGVLLTFVAPGVARNVFESRGGAAAGWGQPHLPVFGYGFFILCGVLAGMHFARRRLESLGYDGELAMRLGLWLLLAGVPGARVFYLVQKSDEVFANVRTVPEFIMTCLNLPSGGLVLFGGLIAGAIAYFVFCRKHGIPPLRMADAVTPSVLLGIGFGRIGCLMYSCCYGDVCDLPWAVRFPEDSIAYTALHQRGLIGFREAVPLHPTQVYSSVSAFLLAGLTAAYFRHRSGDGSVFAVGLITYSVARFTVEVLRSDELPYWFTPLTISQNIAVLTLLAGLGVAWWSRRTPRTPTEG